MKLLDKLFGRKQEAEVAPIEPIVPVAPPAAKPKRQRKPKAQPATIESLNTEMAGLTEAPKKKKKAKVKKEEPKVANPEKDAATAKGEPWVTVVGIELDSENLGNGAFELDWNEIFVARLVKAGFKGKTDHEIVDQWFNSICRNVLLETYEQEMADADKRASNRRNLGGNKTEIS